MKNMIEKVDCSFSRMQISSFIQFYIATRERDRKISISWIFFFITERATRDAVKYFLTTLNLIHSCVISFQSASLPCFLLWLCSFFCASEWWKISIASNNLRFCYHHEWHWQELESIKLNMQNFFLAVCVVVKVFKFCF